MSLLPLKTDRKIYTVTLNPSLDLLLASDFVELGKLNRLESKALVAGGKGLNVSFVLAELGIRSTALGFAAGVTGDSLESELRAKSVDTDFVHLNSGFTRINIKINADTETELNSGGPVVSQEEADELIAKISSLPDDSFVVIAGSMPATLPVDYYERMLSVLCEKKIPFALDVSGDKLFPLLKYKPYVVKPNNFELEDMLGVKITDKSDIISGAESCINAGAENCIVSLGAEGSMLMNALGKYDFYTIFDGETVNTTACGDSMLAGFIAAKLSGLEDRKAMLLATACGAATAFTNGTGEQSEIERIYSELQNA